MGVEFYQLSENCFAGYRDTIHGGEPQKPADIEYLVFVDQDDAVALRQNSLVRYGEFEEKFREEYGLKIGRSRKRTKAEWEEMDWNNVLDEDMLVNPEGPTRPPF